jgi:hypothetical protein
MEQASFILTLVVSSNYARHYIGPPDGNQAGSGASGCPCAGSSIMARSGMNTFRGSQTEQYWNQRWNGAPFFSRAPKRPPLDTGQCGAPPGEARAERDMGQTNRII